MIFAFIAVRKERVTLNNKDVEVEVEEKSGQWLGGTVYSTGMNGDVLVCFNWCLLVDIT